MSERLSEAGFATRLADLAASLAPGERRLVALAGPPGAGKSTFAEKLVAEVSARVGGNPVAILPMDGYHYDDELLKTLGRHERKGAADTFDVGGLRAMLARLAANEEAAVVVPRFDRDIEIARAGARVIGRDVPIVLVEGNYLLLADPPWDALGEHFDMTALIEVPEEELARRLRARWEGFELDEAGIRRKLDEVDLPNGRFVMARSRTPDVIVVQDRAADA